MGRPKGTTKRYCVQGHDTYEVGRFAASYACKACNAGHQIRKRARVKAGILPYQPFYRAMRAQGLDPNAVLSGVKQREFASHGMAYFTADHYATRIGLHPSEVWPDWWEITDILVKQSERGAA